MTIEISFEEDIQALEEQLEHAQRELRELEEQRSQYDVRTQHLRRHLEELRTTSQGKLPKEQSKSAGKIQPLEVNEETGRPARGTRRRQIEQICKKLGRGSRSFRTIDVLNMLEEIEGELSDGMKSYTYAVLTTLRDDDFLKKVSRGTWVLK